MNLKTLMAAAALAGLAFGAQADSVRLGTEGAYPPYNFINDDGEIDGFERELGDELCKRAGLDCTWVKNDWDSIIPNLVSGNYDVIIAGMSATAERDKVIDFTEAYIKPGPSYYVGLSGADESAADGVVAAQVNTIQAGHVPTTGATLVEFATPDETIAAVKNGEADAVLADGDYLRPIIDESGGELTVVKEVSLGGGTAMGIRESDTELKEKLSAAVASVKADGTLNTMLSKWFGEKADLW
ncbi:MAG: transporter substrate-binding domain-containing protein [Pseudomonadota bacterium]